MSEAVEAPVTETQTALAIIPASQLTTILAADGAKSILDALKAELDRFKPDVTTPKGKREIASKAYKVAVAKNDLIRLAGTLKEDAQKVIRGVNAEVRVVEAEMDALRDAVRKPLDDFEAMEARREQGHRDAIVAIEAFATIPENWPSGHIATRLEELEQSELLTRDWQEFAAKAQDAIGSTRRTLERAYQAGAVREAEEAEAARQAAAAAEERRQAEERERLAREERIRLEAAQRAREAAERAAAEEAAEVERLAQAEREAAARREREALDSAAAAEARARQAEAKREVERVERHRSAIRTIEAQDQFSRPPTSAEVQARHDGLREPFAWDFEEFAAEAEAARSAVMSRLGPMYAAAKEGEDAAIEAERVAREAEQKRREEQAVEAERRRREEEEAKATAEAERRAANKAHRTKFNREALTAIMMAMADDHQGSAEEAEKISIAIVTAIATGSVPHVRIEY